MFDCTASRQRRACLSALAIAGLTFASASCAQAMEPASAAAGPPAAQAEIMTAHFAAVTAALRNKDYAAAEVAATAAYQASVRAHGDGGYTAVLAFNLADVRLRRGLHAQAVEPALKAATLAESKGAVSGVDPLQARLLLARAQLPAGGSAAVANLEQAIAAASAQPHLLEHSQIAAVELARHATETRRHATAREAWTTAVRLVQRRPGPDAPLLLARGRIEAAAAGILELADKDDSAGRQTRDVKQRTATYHQYVAELVSVMNALAAEAHRTGPSPEPTVTQKLYAQAMAWAWAVSAKLRSERRDPVDLAVPGAPAEIGGTRHVLPRCNVKLTSDAKYQFPSAARVRGRIGAVVLKQDFDEAGVLRHWAVAGEVGGEEFRKAVTDVAGQFRLVKVDPGQAECRVERERFMVVAFQYK